jgi:zinc transport system permease protein
MLLALFVLTSFLFIFFKRPMYVLTFDEDVAYVDGLPVRWMSIAFNVLCGVAIAVMIPIAGALLVSAIMILPAAVGMRIGRSFTTVIFVSMLVGVIGMTSGLYMSFYENTPPGASITLIFIAIFLVVSILRFAIIRMRKLKKKNN